ncbi:MAG: multifunctional CCA tRNA nucleotidyl transferase/2'3'-cyclic phosphodiesterase/2'nucleotidase/phosphatase [Oceanicoccus sp.]|uniref:multifunctional CCA tRNA nucleotidyl transferase/2'3'-cyclic phosphodiesterase/2'nucleotidase/phosphatase n=1 Tax=Oceanicoccus sp. TaxID=2691044 RepID=UPI002617F5D3|nr:multifunctional CCA tRNA nucleotidyl transferase/2'3'-cyclic phosphodiesterase/2'nucleotidase/phosphatase [Oceanicoccus sp.]MCP3907558.1 multifunctional CCA tRNA nucleotidyl transferase/2'3'-cyclic phosphodiesterase/2'nucleotidase/phosphatase [Oceanicoccus sp.]
MKTYLVGGAVRDKLLGVPYHEHDWVVVGATPEELLSQGYQAVGKDFPVFLHPNTKEEYALARTERKSGPGYTGFDCHTSPDVTLEEDLVRRDLTINAMAQDSNGTIIDPYGGQRDLEQKLLRHVSDAFIEDPLRVLRIARFYARYSYLGFKIADETLQLMQTISAGDELLALPAERIWKELEKALGEKTPQQFFIALQQSNALAKLMPELSNFSAQQFLILEKTSTEKCQLIRFALLLSHLDATHAETLCATLKAPKEYKELAILFARHQTPCSKPFSSAEALLDTIEQLDPFRRESRFEHFLQCCELKFDSGRTTQQLREAYTACKAINAGELARQGLKGKAIAKTLYTLRLEAINQLLNQNG